MARRIAIFITAIFVTLGLVVAAGLIWMTSEEGSRYISDELKKKVSQKTGVAVSFDKIEIDLFPPRIRVQGIESKDRRVTCHVDEAELSPSIIAMLSRELAIEEVYLGSPSCSVALHTADLDKLLKKSDKKTDSAPFDISQLPDFEVFAISDASLKLNIADPGRIGTLDAEIAGFGIDVTRDDDDMEVRFLLERLAGIWQEGEKRAVETIRDLQFRAAVSKTAVDFRHLSARIADADIKLQDARIPLPVWPVGPTIAHIAISSPLETLNRLPLDLPTFKGAIRYDGSFGVKKARNEKLGFEAEGRLQLTDGSVDEFVIGTLNATLSLTPDGILFKDTVLKAAEGLLEIAGNIAFDDPLTTTLDLNLDRMNLAHLLEQVTVDGSYVTQVMSGPVQLKGSLNPVHLAGNVKLDVRDHTTRTDSFRAPNPTIAIHLPKTSVTGPVTITDEIFEAKTLKVKSGSTDVDVSLMFNFPGFFWRLHAQSADLYLEDLKHILGFSVAGHGPVECLIEGPINDPHIRGFGSFKQAFLEGMAFDQVSTSVNYENRILWFEDLAARRKNSRVSTEELVFDFNAKGGLRINTKIDAEQAAIEDIMEVFNIDRASWGNPSGLLFGRVALTYNLKPKRLQVNADVVHDKLQVFEEQFGPDVLKLDWNDGELVVNEFGLTKGKGTISITGALNKNNEMNFIGVATGINLNAINHKAVRAIDADGALQAFVVIEGTLDHPKGTADLRLGNLLRKRARYGPSAIKLTIDDTTVTGNGKLAGGKMILEHLRLDLKRERFEIESYVDKINLLPILDFDSKENKASLIVTGDLALKGRIAEDLRLGGHAELMSVKAKFNDLTFENKAPLKMKARANQFKISKTRFFGPDVVFDFSGTLSPQKLGLKAKGMADLGSISSMVTGIQKTKGNLNFEIRTSGDPDSPTFRGEARLSNGLVRLDGFPDDIRDIAGEITLSPKVARFIDFSAKTAGGTLGMNGEMTLSGTDITSYLFNLNADSLSLSPIENLTLKTSTIKEGLTLRSPVNGGLPTVTGDLEIRDLRYAEDIRFLELADLNVDQLSGTRTTARRPKLLDPKKDFFSFDIRLHGTKNIEAHNNLFDATLVIDDREKQLRFVGTNQNFGFLGRVLGKEGQIRFAGRRFEVKYAAIDFQDPDRPENPYFQVISDGKIRDWRVTMTAEGTVDEYELKFASQPYLPKEDIAFLIMTGLTQAENRQFNASALKLGMPFLGQFGPGGGALPVELQVYSEYSETAGKDTTKIAMGRWVTDDIWVSISSGVGQTRDVGAQVDYKINDEFSLSADYEDEDEGSTGNVGLDLKFRLEF